MPINWTLTITVQNNIATYSLTSDVSPPPGTPEWGFAPSDTLTFVFEPSTTIKKATIEPHRQLFTVDLPYTIKNGETMTFNTLPDGENSFVSGFTVSDFMSKAGEGSWRFDPECTVSSGY